MELKIEKEFADRLPAYRVILMECNVTNSETSLSLKEDMDKLADDIAGKYKVEDINKRQPIAATRQAYKLCGKDPNRYRPSQEQLMRRIVRGLGLYNVNSLVDTGNILSLETGCSVGCFDASKIQGDILTIGIGKPGEPYEGIGRGVLNIEGLPVVRDAVGGIGTPTSDNERTKIELDTTRLVMTIHLFDPEIDSQSIIDTAVTLFQSYCSASDITTQIITAN